VNVGTGAAGAGAEATGVGAEATGAGAEAETAGAPRVPEVVVAGGALFSVGSSALGRFFGADAASVRGATLVATAGGSGVGNGRSCSLFLQPKHSGNSATACTNHARGRLSILKQSLSF